MTMLKKAAVGAAAVLIAGSMMVYAQQRSDGPGGFGEPHGFGGPRDMPGMGGWHPTTQDLRAFADARIAALHAGLELNADQEKTWPAFEQALREFSKMRIDRIAAARDQQPPGNPVERLQRRADAMTTRGTALKHLADAAGPLYQGLDDAQKHRFALLARLMRRHHEEGREHFGERDRDDRDGVREHHMHEFGDEHGTDGPHGMGGRRDGDDDYRGPL
jgi:zinc resistance-associated protein